MLGVSLKQPYWAFRQKHIFYHNNNGSRISTLSKSTINVCSMVCFKINSQVNSHKYLTTIFFYCLLNKTACTFIIINISQVTLHVQIMKQRKFEYVTAAKRGNACFNNDQKRKYKQEVECVFSNILI